MKKENFSGKSGHFCAERSSWISCFDRDKFIEKAVTGTPRAPMDSCSERPIISSIVPRQRMFSENSLITNRRFMSLPSFHNSLR